MMKQKAKIGVIGLGIVGSAIAAHLSEQGYQVTGFEQFSPAHDQGSSHGENRLFRRVPAEGERYVSMAERALELWPSVEKKSGAQLLEQNGCLDIAANGQDWANRAYEYAKKYNVTCERLTTKQAQEKMPFFQFAKDMDINFVPESGILKAEESIFAFQKIARINNANLHFDTKILDIYFANKTIRTEDENEKFDSIIVCAGAWISEIYSDLETVVEKSVLGWYRYDNNRQILPGFTFKKGKNGFYGMPGLNGQSIKIGPARQDNVLKNLVPKQQVTEADKIILNNAIQSYTTLSLQDAVFDSGKITHRPDGHFYIDRHPEHSNILIFSPCSGHGFKYAPVYGEMAEVMIEQKDNHHSIDLKNFSIEN